MTTLYTLLHKLDQFSHIKIGYVYIHDIALFAVLGVLSSMIFLWLRRRVQARTCELNKKLKLTALYRNLNYGVISILFLVLLGPELKQFTLSFVAFSAAIVLAFKELITSLVGSISMLFNRDLTLGAIITVNGLKGEIIETDLLTTTLLEIGAADQYTGKTLTIPNSSYLTNSYQLQVVTNEYVYNILKVPVSPRDTTAAFKTLSTIVQEYVAPYKDEAQGHLSMARSRNMVDIPSAEPRIVIDPISENQNQIVVRFVCMESDRTRASQAILSAFYSKFKWSANPR